MSTADSSARSADARRLKPEEIAYYAAQAGFTGEALRNIVAIALAESGGDVGAIGDGGDSVSLWQVNLPSHPQYDRQRLLTDPAYAAQAAFEISGGGKNFDPWTTWSHRTQAGAANSAQQYLDIAAKAAGQPAAPQDAPETTVTTQATADTSAPLPANATAAQIDEWLKNNRPEVVPFLGNAELKMIAYWGATHDVSDAVFDAAIKGTQYWKTHSAPSRAFDEFLATNLGAESDRIIGLAKDHVREVFTRNGVSLDDPQLGELAKQAIRSGDITLQGQVLNPDGLNAMVAFSLGQAVTGGEDLTGEAGFSADQIMALARSEYMLPITQREADRWAVDILNGNQTEESIRATLNQRAQERYDWLDLSNGRTVQSATDGIIATIAQTLELDPDTIDLLDPKWNQFLEAVDPQTGRRRGRTLGEAVQMARDMDEFEGTAAYRQQGASFQRGLVDFFEGRAA